MRTIKFRGLSECSQGNDFEIEVIGNIYSNPNLLTNHK